MIWSGAHVGEVASLAGKNFTHLLGFNEPDNTEQSNMCRVGAPLERSTSRASKLTNVLGRALTLHAQGR
jgi:hypothetical protein